MLVGSDGKGDFLKKDQQLPVPRGTFFSCGSSPWLLEGCPRSRLAEKHPVTDSVATHADRPGSIQFTSPETTTPIRSRSHVTGRRLTGPDGGQAVRQH